MRVEKTDLDDSVVEDGEAATILISDGKALTTKNRDMNESTHPPNGVHLPNGCEVTGKHPHQQKNGVLARPTKQREPVEDCEEEEDAKEASGDYVLDSLTESMKGVSIQETTTVELEGKLAELTVNSDEEEDTRCASFQSQSSVITVDPPSLPHEEEEEKSEVAEDLTPRGPTAGKPTSFHPNQDNFNHIASKSYSSHNLDRFHNQVAPFVPPQPSPPANGSYLPVEFSQDSFFPSGYNIGVATGGKRGMDDEEETPYKYTRPVEEMGYLPSQPNALSDSSGVRKNRSYFSQISADLSCGGNVVDTSFSPEKELAMKSFRPGMVNLQPQISMTDVDTMLESFSQMDQVNGMGRDSDPGYASENSPPSDNAGSPGSSPTSTYSPPMRPPSNMSQDSGIASPVSDDNLSTVMPSPPEDTSPPSVTMYHSPSAPVYQSPPSMTSAMSPPSTTMYPSPPSVTLYQSSPSGTMYQNPASVMSAMSPASVTTYQNPPSVTPHQNPPSMTSTMSPYSIAGSDDLSMTSAPSPISYPDSLNDYIFSTRRDELRDALDVIAKDVKSMNARKKALHQAVSAQMKTASPAQINTAPVVPNIPAPPCNIPTSVTQQKSVCAEKIAIPPLQKQVRPGAAGKQQQQPPVMKGAVPVVVVPQATTSSTPVTSSQPVLVMNSGQNAPVIVVVSNNPQMPAQATKKKPQLILPRPGPSISESAPKPVSVKAAVKPELASVPKLEPNVSSCSVPKSSVTAGLNGVRPCPSVQPSSGPTSSSTVRRPAQGRNPPQSRMLNIARRLVASMTTSDLQFQDTEGDTYLHVSVCKADRNMVQALLERLTRENLQGMINTQNLMRQTPLYLAVSSNSPEMVELLIQYGADVNVFAEHTRADGRSKEVKAALHCAASNGHHYLSTLQALLAARELNIDLVNSDGHTALHCTILEHGKADSEGGVINNLPIIQALVKHGADPNAQGKKSGKTALMYALESRDIILIEHIVALIDPARLRIYLKTQAFDGSTCQRIMENLQRTLDNGNRQRLHTCFRISSKRDCSTS